MEIQNTIGVLEYSIRDISVEILEILLLDRTTRRNIIWASEDYESYGNDYYAKYPITIEQILRTDIDIIQPRATKEKESQLARTKEKAEVFTPSWMCNIQNNLIDTQWFERENIFNYTNGQEWKANVEKVIFPKKKGFSWKDYVDEKRLEITCGEAPYLVSRYDTVTGKPIKLINRIGLLDRKMRIVNENVSEEDEWLKWTKRAFESIYGFEYQGDSLLLARENLLLTFVDNLWWKYQRKPTEKELREIAVIISWNIWQMDSMSFTVPFQEIYEQYQQMSFGIDDKKECYCKIKDWRSKEILYYYTLIKKEEK